MKKKLFWVLIAIFPMTDLMAQKMKPEETEVWEPEPPIVTPASDHNGAPSDAIILFNGSDLSEWQKPQFPYEAASVEQIESLINKLDPSFENEDANWEIKDDYMIVTKNPIETRRKFSDIQLHIEWLSPLDEGKEGQGYSNSGIFLMGLYEIQVLNSYQNRTYSNGQAGSIYKQHIPLVNASRKPGEWQEYDIIFTAPRFSEEGTLQSPARITAFHNGVLIHNNVELKGPTAYIGKPHYVVHPEKMPLRLQFHGDKVQYRNIWVREL